jgi:hypothetical protein
MRAKNAQSLIVATAPQEADRERIWNGPPPSPFANFVAILEKGRTSSSDDGSIAAWTDFPLERAIASGLWLMMVGLAKNWNVKMTTEHSVAKVAERTDILVNAGLAVGFASSEEAAVAWKKTVEKPIERAFVLGYRPGIDLPLAAWKELVVGNEDAFVAALRAAPTRPMIGLDDVWQKPIASFFAELVKTSRRWASETCGVVAQLEKRNTINRDAFTDTSFTFIDTEVFRDINQCLTVVLDADGSNDAEGGDGKKALSRALALEPMTQDHLMFLYKLFPTIGQELVRCRKRIDLFRKMPHGLCAKKKNIFLGARTVAGEWLRTQILLAVGGHRDEREHLTDKECVAALLKLKKLDNAAVVALTIGRLERHGMKLSPADLAELSAEIGVSLGRGNGVTGIRSWSTAPRKRDVDDGGYGIIQKSATQQRQMEESISSKDLPLDDVVALYRRRSSEED